MIRKRFWSTAWETFRFFKGLIQLFIFKARSKTTVPEFVKDLKLRTPFVTFLYAAVYLSRFLGEEGDASKRVMRAMESIFGIEHKGDEQ